MAKVHFFTEHSKLTPQTPADSFGPDLSNPSVTTIYNISSRFSLSATSKAFACQTGDIIVQESASNSSLVNIILKPYDTILATKVEYYIYRGILKSSLIAGANLIPYSPGINDWITRIYSQNPTNLGANQIGYDNSISGSTAIEDIFGLLAPNIFKSQVKKGESIGDFSGSHKIGFEVIMEADRLNIDIDYLRNDNYQVDTSGLTGLAERAKKEEIVSYIDPAAFFGLFVDENQGVDIFGSNTAKKGEDIYKDLLVNFATKNKVYLDVRNERGYSYNFYNNYDNGSGASIILGDRNISSAPQAYLTNNIWPIVSLDTPQVIDSQNSSRNIIRFNLRVDDNENPVIYIPETEVRSDNIESKFIPTDEILAGNTDWTEEFTFQFPNAVIQGNNSDKDNIAHYIRIYYFRNQIDNYNIIPNTVPYFDHYYNGAFSPINFHGNTHRRSYPHYIREKLDENNGTGNFEFISDSGAYIGTSRVLFYSSRKFSKSDSGKKYLPTYENKLILNNPQFNGSLKNNLDTIVYDYDIAGQNIRIPGVNAYTDQGVLQNKEDLLLLGLTTTELTELRAAPGLSSFNEIHLFLEPNVLNPLTDGNGNRYHVFTVYLQGLDSNGQAHKIMPQVAGAALIVYSRDLRFFSSAAFGAVESETTEGQNRLEFHISQLPAWNRATNGAPARDGCIRIKDNIDLGLVYDTQRMYYLYYALDGTIHEVQNLEIIVAKGKEIGDYVTSNYPSFNPDPNWTNHEKFWDHPTVQYYGVDLIDLYTYDDYALGFGYLDGHVSNSFYRVRKYENTGKMIYMVRFVEFDFAALNIDFNFHQTERFYSNPLIAASFIGVLAEVDFNVESVGFAYADSTCFPSVEHVNGNAADTRYQNQNDDQLYIDTAYRYGFGEIIRGDFGYQTQLVWPAGYGSGHDTHIHAGELDIPECQ